MMYDSYTLSWAYVHTSKTLESFLFWTLQFEVYDLRSETEMSQNLMTPASNQSLTIGINLLELAAPFLTESAHKMLRRYPEYNL